MTEFHRFSAELKKVCLCSSLCIDLLLFLEGLFFFCFWFPFFICFSFELEFLLFLLLDDSSEIIHSDFVFLTISVFFYAISLYYSDLECCLSSVLRTHDLTCFLE